MTGPRIKTNLIDAYVFRSGPVVELLQLRRAREPFTGDWHPVMGHIEPREAAIDTLWRELREEIGLERASVVGAWSLEQVHPYFVPELDSIFLTPRFAVEVPAGFTPRLNPEHDAWRWVEIDEVPSMFLWPGQHAAAREIAMIADPASPLRDALRLPDQSGD